MIEELAKLIPDSLSKVSGKVFYSGHCAFQAGRSVYLLGYNPGGDPIEHATETVESHTRMVLADLPSNWSAYRDESWLKRLPGTATLQPVILQLFQVLGLDPGLVPSSNLVFSRSPRAVDLKIRRELELLCWPFHAAVMEMTSPRLIVCLGRETGAYVGAKLGAREVIDQFVEPNNRRWTSTAQSTTDGRVVVTLTHPSQAKWTTPETDPRPMVQRIFEAMTR